MSRIPFTVYDFFGYLSSGFLVVSAVDLLFGERWLLQSHAPPLLYVFLVVLSYVFGHIVAHFSALALEELFVGHLLGRPTSLLMGQAGSRCWRHVFRHYHKALPAATQARIRLRAHELGIVDSGDALFHHVHAQLTRDPHQKARLEEFRNLYGFARNMAFLFLLATPVLAVETHRQSMPPTYWWAGMSLLIGTILAFRYLKFYRQYAFQLLSMYAEHNPTEE